MEFKTDTFQNQLPHTYRCDQRTYYSLNDFKEQANFVYANEADVLNVALLAKQPNNGEMKTLPLKETSGITPTLNNCWCWQIWRV